MGFKECLVKTASGRGGRWVVVPTVDIDRRYLRLRKENDKRVNGIHALCSCCSCCSCCVFVSDLLYFQQPPHSFSLRRAVNRGMFSQQFTDGPTTIRRLNGNAAFDSFNTARRKQHQWAFNNDDNNDDDDDDDNDDNVWFTFLFVSNVSHTSASRTLLASTA